MTDPQSLDVEARGPGGTYRGTLRIEETPVLRPPMLIGMTPKPSEYGSVFAAVKPGIPDFACVFSPPGHGLPNMNDLAMTTLPAGCLPFIHYKDPVPIPDVALYWKYLGKLYQSAIGRRLKFAFQHEKAPASNIDRMAWLRYWHELKSAAADHPWIELVNVQSNYALRWRRDVRWQDWVIPGVTFALDGYPLEYGRDGVYEPVETAFGLLTAAAEDFDIPSFGVAEFAADIRAGGPAERARYVWDGAVHLRHIGAAFCGLWASHEERGGKTYDYRPTDVETLRVYRQLLEIPSGSGES